jgi:hypothetical protein
VTRDAATIRLLAQAPRRPSCDVSHVRPVVFEDKFLWRTRGPAERRIEWSSASGYRGWMSVTPDGDGSRLTLFLDTRHGSERDHDVAATPDAIRMLVESEV